MFIRIAFAAAFVTMFSMPQESGNAVVVADTDDAYTVRFFLDHLQTIIRVR